MLSKFHDWHVVKDALHQKSPPPLFFKEREVWWCSLGANIGYEQDGKNTDFGRPILVTKKFNHDVLWALPITSKKKENHFHHQFDSFDTVMSGSVVLSQIRLLDAKRLIRKMGTFPLAHFMEVREKLRRFI